MQSVKDLRLTLGRNLKKQRKRKGFTKERLAEAANISVAALGRLEGGTMARLSVVVAVANALDVPVWKLFKP